MECQRTGYDNTPNGVDFFPVCLLVYNNILLLNVYSWILSFADWPVDLQQLGFAIVLMGSYIARFRGLRIVLQADLAVFLLAYRPILPFADWSTAGFSVYRLFYRQISRLPNGLSPDFAVVAE